MRESIGYIKSRLPLTITSAIWDEPLLHLSGESWKFNARTELRLITRDKKIVGCYDEDANLAIEAIKHLQAISVDPHSEYYFDPVFVFENGNVLEVFSTSSSEETWTFHFEDEDIFIESNEN